MEGDAGTRRLNPTEGQERPSDAADALSEDPIEEITEEPSEAADTEVVGAAEAASGSDAVAGPVRRTERFGRGWFIGIAASLLLLTVGVTVGGVLAVQAHARSEAIARGDEVALQRAKECVAATQAPDVAAMTASQTKVIECATGDFGVQANLFASMLVEAYQAANVAVQVSDMRAAIEKHHDDGSVDILVALRVKVTNTAAAGQEQGYRLRVNMQPVDGTYKVNRLDQVTS